MTEAPPDTKVPGAPIAAYRSERPGGFLRVLLPALLSTSLGYSLLAGASSLGEADEPLLSARAESTLPRASIVNEDGDPLLEGPVPFAAYALTGVGAVFILLGPLLLMRHLQRVGDEKELLLCSGALVLRGRSGDTTLPWSDVREVRVEAGSGGRERLALVRQDGSEFLLTERFTGVDTRTLAARIRSVRGRSLFGLLDDR